MKTAYFIFMSFGIAAVSAIALPTQDKVVKKKGNKPVKPAYSRNVAPWLKTKEEKEKEKAAEVTEIQNSYDDGSTSTPSLALQDQRFIISMIQAGYYLLTKVGDIIDTTKTYKARMAFVMGYAGEAPPAPATKADIEALKNQLNSMSKAMTSSFAQVLSGQEFTNVVLNYNRYIHHLQSVALLDVVEHLEDETALEDTPKAEFIDDIIGGMNADSTKFALMKVHEMITGKSIVQLNDLYQVIAIRKANCGDTCSFNLNDLPALASEFNTLQAGVYGALSGALRAKGLEEKADILDQTMEERMKAQVHMLYLAQTRFVSMAGSGPSLLRLRSARGGCLAHSWIDQIPEFYLKDCDDAELHEIRIDGATLALMHRKSPPRCLSNRMMPTEGRYCNTNHWYIEISKVDPRFMLIRTRSSKCLAANVGDPVQENAAVDLVDTCASVEDEGLLSIDAENQFWEFLPSNE